jgi:hypothetical protein
MSDTLSAVVGLCIPVLAQLAPAGAPGTEHSAAIWWLVGLAAVAVAFNQVASAWSRITGRFQERTGGDRLVTEEMCRRQHDTSARAYKDQEATHSARTENLRVEIKSDFKGVHNRIDDVMGAVRALEGTIKTMLTLRKN